MKRNVSLEKFYTKPDVAKFCLKHIDLNKYDRLIEPSAGNGSFSTLVSNCEAYDLMPELDSIKQQDFFEFKADKGNILVFGNPPFGRQSSLAIKFINHAAKFAKTIAFILPKSFSKESVIEKLDKHLHCVKIVGLPKNSFFYGDEDFDIPCSFYIFEWLEKEREKSKKYETEDFEFVTKEKADFSIRRVGFYAGKIEGLEVSKESHYFIKDKNNAIDILKKIKYPSALDTVGSRSISKNEIIKEYLCQKDKNMDLNSKSNI
jgi:predicted RNA methylase